MTTQVVGKRPSSRRWLKEHSSDLYVKLARQVGFRSRSVFKLLEINERDRILKRGMIVIDLGAAPGGWSQVAAAAVGPEGCVIAVDLLPMASLDQVTFIRGDVREDSVVQELLSALNGRRADLVLSDMAPNISGMKAVDQARMMHLGECVMICAAQVLRRGGDLLIKVFQGEGFEAFVNRLRQSFEKVYTRKPRASRGRSAEVYVIARCFYGV